MGGSHSVSRSVMHVVFFREGTTRVASLVCPRCVSRKLESGIVMCYPVWLHHQVCSKTVWSKLCQFQTVCGVWFGRGSSEFTPSTWAPESTSCGSSVLICREAWVWTWSGIFYLSIYLFTAIMHAHTLGSNISLTCCKLYAMIQVSA